MTSVSPRVILITGPSAAGKSTVAQAVAERLPLSVHLRGDVFRKMIVNGRADFRPELDDKALRQLRLRYDLAVAAALCYLEAGFNVVYQDIVIGPDLERVAESFRAWPLTVIVLAPDIATLARREAERTKTAYGNPAEIEQMLRAFTDDTPHIGTWIESTHLTINDTVDTILALLGPA